MERLRELRKQASMTMKQVGAALGLAESTVSLYETGKRNPDLQTLICFADFFNVSLDYLCERDEATNSKAPIRPDFSRHEVALIKAYRQQPISVQHAICDIMHIEHPAALKAN